MSWFSKPSPEVEVKDDPVPAPLQFSKSVGEGYVDTQNYWYVSKEEADLASAHRHLRDTLQSNTLMSGTRYICSIDRPSWEEMLNDSDIRRAMIIVATKGGIL